MIRMLRAALFLLALMPLAARADDAPKSGNPVIDRTVEIVDQRFYDPDALPAFHQAVRESVAGGLPQDDPVAVDRTEDAILASLGASHTARYTRERVDYYELSDVFRFALRRDLRRLYPPRGEVAYPGIGIASRVIDGTRFVTDVYDSGPAAGAGLMAGDEIVSVDGAPFSEIGSFVGKIGDTVDVVVRRQAGAAAQTIAVPVERIQPTDMVVASIKKSVRVVQRGNRRVGVVHIWSWTTDRVAGALNAAFATTLKDVDGLILDLRSRWGGAPADAAELFVGGSPDMTMIERDGEPRYINQRFHKPVVAIIDEGTRSGMEILAYALKKNGIPLVGTPTAGDVLAGTGFLLPDDSFLILAVADVTVDGGRLEANPITPRVPVPFDVRYASGADPQMDAALAVLDDTLAGVNAD
jgi:C-terminal processing protease CtpA/Prc